MVCDIVWRARELALDPPSPAWLDEARARNLESFRRALLAAGDLARRHDHEQPR